MNGSKFLVDTNIVLYFLQVNDEIARFFSDYDLAVFFKTELELLSFGQFGPEQPGQISPEDDQVIRPFL